MYQKKVEPRPNKDICFQLRCHHRRQHLGLVTPSARWRWRGGGGGGGWGYLEVEEKEMLSRRLNEGRFTQNNDGWTRGFTADVYLKRDGKYSFGTEGVICRYTYHPPTPDHHRHHHTPTATTGPHMRAAAICSIAFLFCLKGGEIREASSARLSESGRQTATDRRKIPTSWNFGGGENLGNSAKQVDWKQEKF